MECQGALDPMGYVKNFQENLLSVVLQNVAFVAVQWQDDVGIVGQNIVSQCGSA